MKTASHPKLPLLLLLLLGLIINPALQAQDQPAPPPAPAAPSGPAETSVETEKAKRDEDTAAVEATADDAAASNESDKPAESEKPTRHSRHSRHSGNERVSFGSDSTLAEGESAQAVISIGGSSSSAGDVADAVVSIGGGSRVTAGNVGNSVVSVFGNTYVNAHVHGEVVTILGSVEFGPDAVVDGEVVCVGGQIKRDSKALLKGNIQNIGVLGHSFDFTGLTTWISKCLFYGRPLAFDSHLWWAWAIAFGFLALYVVVALVAPKGVAKCVETLEQRPGSSLLAALLTLILTPVAYILLLVTVFIAVGAVLIPAFSLGLFFASVFGKIVMLAWLGRRFTNLFGNSALAHPVFGVLIGGLVVLGLYTIPIVGFVVFKLLGVIGLGVVVFTLILMFKASRPPKPVVVPAVAPTAPAVGVMSGDVPPPLTSAAPPVISASTLPRVGFWLRLGASVLDLILIGIAIGVSEGVFRMFHFHPGSAFPFWVAAYCVVMWATKGTTIGGIICGLKVVRLDDRPIDWGIAIVRGLSSFLSLFVAGIGFIWVAFDDDKQSWHDKIAGTTIVKVPKGTALL